MKGNTEKPSIKNILNVITNYIGLNEKFSSVDVNCGQV